MKIMPGAWRVFPKASCLYFYIIWFRYSFYLTFYSIFKSYFIFWSPSCLLTWRLVPFPTPSAPQPPHEPQRHCDSLSSSPRTTSLPTVPALSSAGTCFPQIFTWQVPSCNPNFSLSATAPEKPNLATRLPSEHLEFFHPYIYRWVFSCLFLFVCLLSVFLL